MEPMNHLQRLELEELRELYDVLGLEAGAIDTNTGNVTDDARFKVTDADQLNWVLRKMQAITADLIEKQALRDKELSRINGWYDGLYKTAKADMDYFQALVTEYAAKKRESDPKYKGESTPYGKVSFTKQQPEWAYKSEEETVGFLEADESMKDHVKVIKSIANKTALKKELTVMRNVFVKDGLVVDAAQEVEDGYAGMQYHLRPAYASHDVIVEVIDLETGEKVDNVELMPIVAVLGDKVVPGIHLEDRDYKIGVKVE